MVAIDTAPAYGMGRSEEVVGRALEGRRDEAIVMTKCGLRWDRTEGERFFETEFEGRTVTIHRNLRPDSIREECEASLSRLRTDRIDLYQCHWPDSTTPIAETMGELARLREEGKIRAIGVSNFTPEMMEEARAALGDVPLASDQPKYNLLDRGIEEDVLPFCLENDIGVIVYSPIAQGLLTGKMTADRELGEGDLRTRNPLFSTENRRRINAALDDLRPLAEQKGATLAQLSMAWLLHRPGVTAVIAGARNAAQARENARTAGVSLTGAEADRVARTIGELELAE
jgi:aryl-alcohol dehydrogenase-like predicted oxidoreductase